MNREKFPTQEAEKRLNYTFKDKNLLITAFTHVSLSNKTGCESNERLEFLGDAVLELAVSEKLYAAKPKLSEGEMTALRQRYVAKPALERAADKLNLTELFLICGSAANTGKKAKSSLVESVIAAIYLDGNGAAGDGYENAKAFIFANVEPGDDQSYRNELQELLQKNGEPLPVYETLEKKGADNNPTFAVRASARGIAAEAEGKTIQEAEIAAAKRLLDVLRAQH